MLDFNDAPEQRAGDLIPDNEIVQVHLTVRPGNTGDGGWERRSKDGGSTAVDAELTVVEGKYAKRKLWSLMTVSGTTDGHKKAIEISRGRIRAMLEAVHGIHPSDQSQEAKARRQLQHDYGELDGLRFLIKVGIEKGGENPATGQKYNDKNSIKEVITPDKQAYSKIEQTQEWWQRRSGPQVTALPGGGAQVHTPSTQGGMQKPSWA